MSQELTAKQRKALYLLAEGYALSTVARRVKVRRETLSRWRQLPEFQEESNQLIASLQSRLGYRMTELGETVLNRFILDVNEGVVDSWDLFRLLHLFCLPHAKGQIAAENPSQTP